MDYYVDRKKQAKIAWCENRYTALKIPLSRNLGKNLLWMTKWKNLVSSVFLKLLFLFVYFTFSWSYIHMFYFTPCEQIYVSLLTGFSINQQSGSFKCLLLSYAFVFPLFSKLLPSHLTPAWCKNKNSSSWANLPKTEYLSLCLSCIYQKNLSRTEEHNSSGSKCMNVSTTLIDRNEKMHKRIDNW